MKIKVFFGIVFFSITGDLAFYSIIICIMSSRFSVLVIDDESEILNSVEKMLKDEFNVIVSNSFDDGICKIRELKPDVVIVDLRLGEKDGRDIVKFVVSNRLNSQVIVISAYSDIENIVECIKMGAFDFVEKPISPTRLRVSIRNAIDNLSLKRVVEKVEFSGIIFKSQKMSEVIELVKKASNTNFPVLILGESGTGKEKIAHLIHSLSRRRDKEFVKINCSAIPSELFESELFGYEKGAFTGAVYSKKGKFEIANGGTIFLDEIGDLSLEHQAKILRAVEYGEIMKVGSKDILNVDVRLVSATNKDIEKMVKEKTFREDLFFRINVITIYLPPLRERKEDIKPLALYFLEETIKREGLPQKIFSEDALSMLEEYDFPGNIRELKNIVNRLIVISQNDVISTQDVEKVIKNKVNPFEEKIVDLLSSRKSLVRARSDFEKIYILYHLEKNNMNISKTANSLGILPNNLIRRMKKLGIGH